MVVAGYALRQLTGILSGDDVMFFWENRVMEHKLETLGTPGLADRCAAGATDLNCVASTG
jgi:hypothetical protein